MSGRREPAVAAYAVGFVLLLALAVLWPAPVALLNGPIFRDQLAVDGRSFLGREAPALDLAYWCIAGIYLLSLLHGRLDTVAESWPQVTADARRFLPGVRAAFRSLSLAWIVSVLVAGIFSVAVVWIWLDAPLMGVAEAVQSGASKAVIRLLNRFGGGMNPLMVVSFFLLAGMAFAIRRWWLYAIAMTGAGLSGGIAVNVIKLAVGRSRPELWTGPFHYVDTASSSFPSGHTVGAFAIAAVLFFAGRSRALRVASIVLALAVAASRVLAFRHWPSDVFASSIVGLVCGWIFVNATFRENRNA